MEKRPPLLLKWRGEKWSDLCGGTPYPNTQQLLDLIQDGAQELGSPIAMCPKGPVRAIDENSFFGHYELRVDKAFKKRQQPCA